MTRRPAGWYPLLLATGSIGIANSVVFALLSNLQDKYGFSDAGLGLIAGSGFLVGLIGQILLAPFADRGHSKTLLLAGLACAVLGNVLFAVSGSLSTLVASPLLSGFPPACSCRQRVGSRFASVPTTLPNALER